MPDTSLGITYPASTSHDRLWEHFQTLADDLNALLLKRPIIQAGQLSISFTGLNSYTQAVTFPTPFTTVPRVAMNLATGAGATARWSTRAISVTTTGFTLFAYYNTDTTTLFTWSGQPVDWIAVGGVS